MEALGFNVRDPSSSHLHQLIIQASSGVLEGIVRGYKAGLLTQGAYHNLTQCENLEGESFLVRGIVSCRVLCPSCHRFGYTLHLDAYLFLT
jgi:hypothetical protein